MDSWWGAQFVARQPGVGSGFELVLYVVLLDMGPEAPGGSAAAAALPPTQGTLGRPGPCREMACTAAQVCVTFGFWGISGRYVLFEVRPDLCWTLARGSAAETEEGALCSLGDSHSLLYNMAAQLALTVWASVNSPLQGWSERSSLAGRLQAFVLDRPHTLQR